MEIKILHLLYDLMNLYGEYGNVNVIKYRLEKQGVAVSVDKKSIGDEINLNDWRSWWNSYKWKKLFWN